MTDPQRRLRVGSCFAGIGGFDLAAEAVGLDTVWTSEIDPAAADVLAARFPDAEHVGNIAGLHGADLPAIDVLAGGSPCQGFSTAGLGGGLGDPRSGMFGEFIRIARETAATWVLWENVPGAFTTNDGKDFEHVIGALVGADRPVELARTGRSTGWATHGQRAVVWRVLDAQHFGVPQRRRRVFALAGPVDQRPWEVLLELERGTGDPHAVAAQGARAATVVPPGAGGPGGHGHPAGRQPAGDTGAGTAGDGERLTALPYTVHGEHSTAMRGGGDADVAFETDRARCLDTTGGYATNQGGTLVAQPARAPIPIQNAASRDGQAKTPSKDAAGFVRMRDPGLGIGDEGDPQFTLDCSAPHAVAVPVRAEDVPVDEPVQVPFRKSRRAASSDDAEGWVEADVSNTMNLFDNGDVRATEVVVQAEPDEGAVRYDVRRLLPLECERLQGFPDGWTEPAGSDGARYRTLGNAVAVPVAAWVLARLDAHERGVGWEDLPGVPEVLGALPWITRFVPAQ